LLIRDQFAAPWPVTGSPAGILGARFHSRLPSPKSGWLKPAGLDPGPVLPLAERAVATGDVQPVYELLADELRRQLEGRLGRVGELAAFKDRSVADARAWVEAMLGFEVYAHHTYAPLHSGPHGEHHNG
jgi:hypothetical protein